MKKSWTIVSFVFSMLLVAGLLGTVVSFAMQRQQILYSYATSFSANGVAGDVKATYQVANEEEKNMYVSNSEETTLTLNSSSGILSPKEDIVLTAQNSKVVLKYSFTNSSEQDYYVTLIDSFTKTNIFVKYSIDGENYLEDFAKVTVPQTATGESPATIFIEIGIENVANNASYSGNLNFLLSLE